MKHLWVYLMVLALVILALAMGAGLGQAGPADGDVALRQDGDAPLRPQVGAPAGAARSNPLTRPGSIVLWNQYDNAGTHATSSQNFEPTLDAYDSLLADDFIVPQGASWSIDLIEVDGAYFNGAGPAASVNVTIYDHNYFGLPRQVEFSRSIIAYMPGPDPGDFLIPLNPPALIPPGPHYLMIQANQDLKTAGQWGWTNRTVGSGVSGAVWRNPGDGFRRCADWNRRLVGCWIDPDAPDQVFRLSGQLATPTPGPWSPTPTGTPPPPPPTRTPTPTPGPRCALLPPDPYGYRCTDTQAHTFIEGATSTGLTQDDQVVSGIPIGFPFHFYSGSYTYVNVSSNGNLQFTQADAGYQNTSLPAALLGPMLALYWDDLYLPACTPTCGVYYSTIGSPGNRTFIVEYRGVPRIPQSSGPPGGFMTFEVQLEEATGDIWMVYQTMPPPDGNGNSATVGIQDGTRAFQYSFDQINATHSNLAIRYFRPRPTPTSSPTPTPPPLRCAGIPPDPFGYRCDDTATRPWITATTQIRFLGNFVEYIPIGFTYNFYGSSYTYVGVSVYGDLQFTTEWEEYNNACPMPDPVMGPLIAPFWDDLYLPFGGSVWYSTTGTAPNRVLTVEYRDVPHFPSSPSGATFEAQLEEATGDIYLLYEDLDFGVPAFNYGASATVGIQNGSVAFQYSCNQPVLVPGRTIRIYRNVTPTPTPTATTGSYWLYLPLIRKDG